MIHSKFTAVINVVGLSDNLIHRMPFLSRYSKQGKKRRIRPAFPAVTCTAQATYLTGLSPNKHGIVGNGWYFRELSQIWFWRQSHQLVSGEKIWETAKRLDPKFTCANLFWWFNMYSSVDLSVTPRPIYRADGQKLPDVYSEPPELRHDLQKDLGTFPLFHFWGPRADIRSSEWIASAAQYVSDRWNPKLSLIYLPHLDYCLQKYGPAGVQVEQELLKIDKLCEELTGFFNDKQVQVLFISEYGINEVNKPIKINAYLRESGWIRVREEIGEEHLDPGASRAFAVVDHQIAHVYLKNPDDARTLRGKLEAIPGIHRILGKKEQEQFGIAHSRSGDFVVIAEPSSWFSYTYWLNDSKAPDFARTVDIHRKPGYDPAELFLDPEKKFLPARVFAKVLKKKLGFRTMMDVIPLDDRLVGGSHGSPFVSEEYWPVLICPIEEGGSGEQADMDACEVRDEILKHIFPNRAPSPSQHHHCERVYAGD